MRKNPRSTHLGKGNLSPEKMRKNPRSFPDSRCFDEGSSRVPLSESSRNHIPNLVIDEEHKRVSHPDFLEADSFRVPNESSQDIIVPDSNDEGYDELEISGKDDDNEASSSLKLDDEKIGFKEQLERDRWDIMCTILPILKQEKGRHSRRKYY